MHLSFSSLLNLNMFSDFFGVTCIFSIDYVVEFYFKLTFTLKIWEFILKIMFFKPNIFINIDYNIIVIWP
jgi:hypothetical protein